MLFPSIPILPDRKSSTFAHNPATSKKYVFPKASSIEQGDTSNARAGSKGNLLLEDPIVLRDMVESPEDVSVQSPQIKGQLINVPSKSALHFQEGFSPTQLQSFISFPLPTY